MNARLIIILIMIIKKKKTVKMPYKEKSYGCHKILFIINYRINAWKYINALNYTRKLDKL